jgi:hypothetical protein
VTCLAMVAARLPPPPTWKQRREVAQSRVGRRLTLTLVPAPRPAVLVRNLSPAEVWDGSVRNHAEGIHRIDDGRRAHCAQMGPLVTEVEDINELFARLEARQGDPSRIYDRVI